MDCKIAISTRERRDYPSPDVIDAGIRYEDCKRPKEMRGARCQAKVQRVTLIERTDIEEARTYEKGRV